MIKQVINKDLSKYEFTNKMRGQAFAKNEDNIYIAIRTKEVIRKGVYDTFYILIPLLNTHNSVTKMKHCTKGELLRDYDVYVSSSKEDCKKLIMDLLAA